jgi:hypothetical protein
MKNDLNALLVKGLGKKAVMDLAEKANVDPEFYLELLHVIENGEVTPAMKASWVLGNAARLDSTPAQRHGWKILGLLKTASIGGVQRELLKVLEVVKFKDNADGEFVDYCFDLMRRPGIDVGIRYYCLRILQRKVMQYPELKDELMLTLEEILDWHNQVWKKYLIKAMEKLRKKKLYTSSQKKKG